jgi:hypothetical protein
MLSSTACINYSVVSGFNPQIVIATTLEVFRAFGSSKDLSGCTVFHCRNQGRIFRPLRIIPESKAFDLLSRGFLWQIVPDGDDAQSLRSTRRKRVVMRLPSRGITGNVISDSLPSYMRDLMK